jgi:hypothetical protein
VDPVTVLAIARDDFLESVGAHARGAHEAEIVMAERLAPVAS